ncbi:PepSY-associated TM helix domain-containing protein [Methylomonas sp. 11b]|uniref:PepSY-associated TM helix domain-containing protein n=1 Tax=Methylomonas sp. 11b TaxID=1168169 RepID=UPI00047E1D90|nr:PepSY-associated TM helix domain-containing protein [Methylomonas sp. 11b]
MLSSITIAKADTRLAKLKARRKLWLDVHLYLGLIAGAVLAVVGLTGSFAVFFVELQEVLNPELAIVSTPPEHRQKLRSLDEIVAAAESVKPQGSRFFKVYYPRKSDIAYKLLYFVRDDKQANNGDGYYIFIDPYTARVNGTQLYYLKDRYWGRPIVGFIMQLHWCLLQGRTGANINGILAAISSISVLTGLILWWPLTGKFKQALTVKRNASVVRFNFDLHKTFGFYSAIVLLPVLFSGVYFNLPEQINVLVKLFSPVSRPTAFNSIPAEIRSKPPQAGQQALSLSTVEAIVQEHYPTGRLWMLDGPKSPEGVYKVMKKDVTELSHFVGYRDIALDQYSGEIVKVYDKSTGSNGDIFLDWQWPLHSGYAFGWTGRMLVFFSGLACPVLYITGVIRWLQKRRAKQPLKSHRQNQSQPAQAAESVY